MHVDNFRPNLQFLKQRLNETAMPNDGKYVRPDGDRECLPDDPTAKRQVSVVSLEGEENPSGDYDDSTQDGSESETGESDGNSDYSTDSPSNDDESLSEVSRKKTNVAPGDMQVKPGQEENPTEQLKQIEKVLVPQAPHTR